MWGYNRSVPSCDAMRRYHVLNPARMKLRLTIIGFIFAAFALCVRGSVAQDGLRGLLPRAVQGFSGATGGFAAADFDQDSKPDGALLFQNGSLNGQALFRIELHVSSGRDSVLAFVSGESALEISAADVNHDGVPDIVVERAFTRQRLNIFLNDGHGGFEKADPNCYSAEDNSTLAARTSFNSQNVPISLLPATRPAGAWALESKTGPSIGNTTAGGFWPEVLEEQCGARAPATSRAPPFLLSL